MNDVIPGNDKKKLSVSSTDTTAEGKSYWLTRTCEERLSAVELIRRIVYGEERATSRLQRVIEVIELKHR